MASSSMEKMEEGSGGQTAAPVAAGKQEPSWVWEYHLRKYLMLLATLVATATYAAGLSPPGGFWKEKDNNGHEAGDPILYNEPRYLAFFYLNATAFAASLVVNLLLLVISDGRTASLAVLRVVMVLDLLALMGAYAAGSCRDVPTTVYASVLVVALAAYVGIHILLASYPSESESPPSEAEERSSEETSLKEKLKVLMLLATFAVGISYGAGLSPPGGFHDEVARPEQEDGHRAGDPVMLAKQSPRLMAFFYCNTAAFVASLLVIVLLLGGRLQRYYAKMQLYSFILLALFGLLGAFAAGSSREVDRTAYVVALVGAVPAYIFLVTVLTLLASNSMRLKSIPARASRWLQERGCHGQQSPSPARELSPATSDGGDETEEGLEKVKSLVLLLATLAATVTYTAGLDPPGGVWEKNGVWEENGKSYKAGDPILLTTNAPRYNVFFYCNSTAFVASLVVILMVQNKSLVRWHALEAAMVLDLFGLIGAYAAGSCRDVSTSVYVVALAGAVMVYVVIHVLFFTLDDQAMSDGEKRKLEKRRKRLLLLAILVATITYQAGLTPPGGFWKEPDSATVPGDVFHGDAGSAILHEHHKYQGRYWAFFYCNSTSFMASVALIIMLVNPNLYRPGIRCYALYVCMVAALLGLMGAYAAGSARLVQTSIYVFLLVGAVVAFIVVQLLAFLSATGIAKDGSSSSSSAGSGTANESSSSSRPRRGGGGGSSKVNGEETARRRKYLMLLAILAASVTYQAGLKPPGGDDDEGNPMMHESNPPRYKAFFYCNSTSFVASVVAIVLLLQESLSPSSSPGLLYAMNTAIVLDVLGLLGAYAAGSSREEWGTFAYVLALVAAVLAYVAVHLAVWFLGGQRALGKVSSSGPAPPPEEHGDASRPPPPPPPRVEVS